MQSDMQFPPDFFNLPSDEARLKNHYLGLWKGQRHLLNTSDLRSEQIETFMSLAGCCKIAHLNNTQISALKGKLVANVFYENSTRTRCSFEVAAKTLGAEVLNL